MCFIEFDLMIFDAHGKLWSVDTPMLIKGGE
jgi:hypothetical protein